MNNEVKFDIKIKVDGKAEISASAKSMTELGQTMDVAKSAALRLSDSMQRMASKVVAIRGMAESFRQIADSLNAVTEESRSFETSMRAANTMAGKNAEGYSELKNQVAELAKTVPVAREALASGLYQVVSNGVPEDNWIGFLEQSVKASVGGIADLGQVVGVTSTIIKNYALGWDAAAEIQDKIQMTAKNGVTSFEQLAAALPRVTANAATLGVSIDELMATFATLTGVSGNTAEVSTQLAGIFTALVKPSSEATEMAKQMGIQFDAAAIKAAGGMQNFLKNLDQSIKSYAASSGMLEAEIQGKLFGSAESLRALIPLVGNLSEKYSENVQAMADSTGSIGESYEEMSGTAEAQLQILKNKWGEVTDFIHSAIGKLQPALSFTSQLGMTVSAVTTLTLALREYSIGTKLAAVATRTFTASTRALAVAQGPMRSVMLSLTATTRVLTAAMRGATIGATTLKMAIRGLMAATVVGAAIAALGFVIEKLIGWLSGAENAADDAANSMDDFGKSADTVQEAYDSTLSSTYSDLMTKYEKLKQGWKSLSSEQEKIDWIKNNQTAFADLRLEVNSLTDAESIFSNNTDAVVEAFKRRAQAAARMAQLTELYRKQMEMQDAVRKDAEKNGRNAKEGDLIPEGWRSSDYGYVERDGKWHFHEKGAKRYSGTDISSSRAAQDLQKEIDEKEALFEEETKAANEPILPATKPPKKPGDKDNNKNTNTNTNTDKTLIENAKTYKDLTDNVAYYQQEIEKCNLTDTERLKTLMKGKVSAEAAVQSFKDMSDAASVPAELKSIDDYDKKLSYLRKQRQSASKEQIAGIDAEIKKTEEAKKALEDSSIAGLKTEDIKTYDELNAKISYYTRLLNSGDAAQREFAQRQIDSLKKVQDEWDATLNKPKEIGELSTMKDIDAAIQFYTQRQQTEDADQIQRTQLLIAELTEKKQAFELGIELPDMQRTFDEIRALSGKDYILKVKSIGFDAISAEIKKIDTLLKNPNLTDEQREQLNSLREGYKQMGKDVSRSSVTADEAIKQMGQSLSGLGDAIGVPELNVAGTMAQAIATMVQGYAAATAEGAKLGPWGWIAFAALGLAQLTAMISSVKNVAAFAQGGIVSGPTMALVGEYAGASNNPEVIAPLDKLRSMLHPQGGVGGTVRFEIEGRKLVGVIGNEKKLSRTKL